MGVNRESEDWEEGETISPCIRYVSFFMYVYVFFPY